MTSAQLLAVLVRDVPHRLALQSRTFVELLSNVLQKASEDYEADDLRETCLGALQAFARGCNLDAQATTLCVSYALKELQYDPNSLDTMDEDDDDDEFLDEYSEDMDQSWRIRRGACRLIMLLFEHQNVHMQNTAVSVIKGLGARLMDREESVRLEALQAIVRGLDGNASALPTTLNLIPLLTSWQNTTLQLSALEALSKMVDVRQGALDHLDSAVHFALQSIDVGQSGDIKLRLGGLTLLRVIMTWAPQLVIQQSHAAARKISDAVHSGHRGTVLEGFQTASVFAKMVGPRARNEATLLWDTICDCLEHSDADAQIREAALSATADMFVVIDLGDTQLKRFLNIVQVKLSQEMTRTGCLRIVRKAVTFPKLRGNALVLDFARGCLMILVDLSRRVDHATDALLALHDVAMLLKGEAQPALKQIVSANVPTLGSPALRPALELIELAVQNDPGLAGFVAEHHLLEILRHANDLQGEVLTGLCDLIRTLSQADASLSPVIVHSIESAWQQQVTSKTSITHLPYARCLSAAASTDTAWTLVTEHAKSMIMSSDVHEQSLGFHVIGTLGQKGALVGWVEAPTIYAKAKHGDQPSCTVAMAGMLLGDPQFLSPILQDLEQGDLDAVKVLREALNHASSDKIQELVPCVWTILTGVAMASKAPDASANCLARIVGNNPARLSDVAKLTRSPEPAVRALASNVLRGSLSLDNTEFLQPSLNEYLHAFLEQLVDPDLTVRRAAVLTLHAGLNNCPTLDAWYAPEVFSMLFDATVVREELKRKVMMGPFTVIQDDGLDLRKNAYETMLAYVETAWKRAPLTDLLRCLARALADDDAVKLLGCLVLTRLAELAGTTLVGQVDEVAPPLQAIFNKKLRDNATKQEIEKSTELLHAAAHVLARLAPLSGTSSALGDLLVYVRSSPHAQLLAQCEAEVL